MRTAPYRGGDFDNEVKMQNNSTSFHQESQASGFLFSDILALFAVRVEVTLLKPSLSCKGMHPHQSSPQVLLFCTSPQYNTWHHRLNSKPAFSELMMFPKMMSTHTHTHTSSFPWWVHLSVPPEESLGCEIMLNQHNLSWWEGVCVSRMCVKQSRLWRKRSFDSDLHFPTHSLFRAKSPPQFFYLSTWPLSRFTSDSSWTTQY